MSYGQSSLVQSHHKFLQKPMSCERVKACCWFFLYIWQTSIGATDSSRHFKWECPKYFEMVFLQDLKNDFRCEVDFPYVSRYQLKPSVNSSILSGNICTCLGMLKLCQSNELIIPQELV